MVEQGITCRRCGGMMIEAYSDLLSPGEKGKTSLVGAVSTVRTMSIGKSSQIVPMSPIPSGDIGMDTR